MTQQHQVPIFAPSPVAVLPPVREPNHPDEANHRIANNLQLLSAVISLDARRVTDPEMPDFFAAIQRRIGAIANVHRQLYIAPDKAFVDLGAYLCELAEELDAAAAAIEGGSRIRVEPAAVDVLAEDATAVGIIVSELVGNAFKYAYAQDAPGLVRIVLRARPHGGYWLEVSDRGCGMDRGQLSRGTGVGSQLVAMMAQRLRAAHRWHDNAPGTRFTLCVEPR